MYDLFDFLPRSSLLGSFVTFFGVLSIVYFKQKGKGQQKMSCNIVINQKPSLPASDRSAPKAKAKDQKRVKAACRGRENYMKKPKERLLKDNQKTQMTLKEFIDYFQQDLNDTASTPMAIEETMRIMKEKHNTEINISIGGIDHAANAYQKSACYVSPGRGTNHPYNIRCF